MDEVEGKTPQVKALRFHSPIACWGLKKNKIAGAGNGI
jgi:hypothetical protein